ncbi:MAG: 23S rRNA (adenine(2503)-C(2))-methyltransferase RlmN [Gemmatimonadota bacterium]|nr:23S rRNA (adenine(2503)-C(2))-methyltransferase RlmN [Gemmatimonadota bacterium]
MSDGEGAGTARRPELLGLEPEAARAVLTATLAELGEPAWRTGQVLEWVYGHRCTAFADMTNLPLELRTSLADRFRLAAAEPSFEARAADGTLKHLWRLDDGEQVESVLIPDGDRITLCLSSQAGCALGCRFCATGDFGFRRQLRPAEIAGQFRDADRVALREYGAGIANVVYMGMGEPFANPDAVFTSLSVLHAGFGLGARRITVSTVGIIPGILALAERPEPFRLAVSLHAPDQDLRRDLMPVEKRYPLPALVEAMRTYQSRRGRRISIEYALIRDVNDSPGLARRLAALLDGLRVFVNLIPWNPIPGRDWRTSTPTAIAAFRAELEAAGIPAAVRTPRGLDIAAACGQLRLEREIAARGT